MVVFAVLFQAINTLAVILSRAAGLVPCFFIGLVTIVAETALYNSYQSHDKNVMKGMMGVLLANLFYGSAMWIGTGTAVDNIFGLINAAVLAVLGVNHFIINSDRSSRPENIKVNQTLVVIIFITNFIWNALVCIQDFSVVRLVVAIAGICSMFGIAATIVCVESRLDAYRLDREAAGWTEKDGYPEGYVHEFEKK